LSGVGVATRLLNDLHHLTLVTADMDRLIVELD
jgi:hypothetical protein